MFLTNYLKSNKIYLLSVITFLYFIIFHVEINIIYGNYDFFNNSQRYILSFLAVIFIFFLLFFVSLGLFFNKNISLFFSKLLLFLTLFFIAEFHFLPWSYGALTGDLIEWGQFKYRDYVDLFIFILFFLFFYFYLFKFVLNKKFILNLLFLLILINLFSYFSAINKQTNYANNANEFSITDFSVFSNKENILLIILDSFGSDIFSNLLTKKSYDFLKDFTFYNNVSSNVGYTDYSLPNIISGKNYNQYNNYEIFRDNVYKDSVVSSLINKDFESQVVTLQPQFCHISLVNCMERSELLNKNMNNIYNSLRVIDYSLFQFLPHIFKKNIFNDSHWFLQTGFNKKIDLNKNIKHFTPQKLDFILIDQIISNFSISEKKQFKILHLNIPHNPAILDKNCKDIKSDNENIHLIVEQSECALLLVEKFINFLKQNSLYEFSKILIISDHGHKFKPFSFENNSTLNFIPERSLPLFLVKEKNVINKELKINQVSITLSDTRKFIENEFYFPKQKKLDSRYFVYYDQFKRRSAEESIWEVFKINGHVYNQDSWFPAGRVIYKKDSKLIKLFKTSNVVDFNNINNEIFLSLFGWTEEKNDNYPFNLNNYGSLYFFGHPKNSSIEIKFFCENCSKNNKLKFYLNGDLIDNTSTFINSNFHTFKIKTNKINDNQINVLTIENIFRRDYKIIKFEKS